MSLAHITQQVPLALDGQMKGVSERLAGASRQQIADLQLSLLNEDVPLPVATLKASALQRNSQWMHHYLEAAGVSLAPHGKTTIRPELFALQHHDGCWGLTLATY